LQLRGAAGPRRVPALERRAQRLERRWRSVPPERLNRSHDDFGVGIVEIGDRPRLYNRCHPHIRDLVEESPAAGHARRQCTVEQWGTGRLVDAEEVYEDRGLLAACHAANVVVRARKNPTGDFFCRVPLHERGVDLAVARVEVRSKDIIQIRKLSVWQATERFQCRAASRILNLAENQWSRLVWGKLR